MNALVDAVFRGKASDDSILIWQSATKTSSWFNVSDTIDASLYKRDTYFGCGTRPSSLHLGATKRGGSSHVSGIGAFWLDIDIASDAHKKDRLPASEAQAIAMAEDAFPALKPSAIVHSGHGFQMWYLLTQWTSVTDSNREMISDMLIGFSDKWRAYCASTGFDADSVCDLSRVMRLPGTTNHKIVSAPVPVELRFLDSMLRYNLSVFAQATPVRVRVPVFANPIPTKDTDDVVIPVQEFPTEELQFLLETNNDIMATWNNRNPKLRDQSPSAYDMSLAQYCIRAGFSIEATQSVLKQFRRKHSLPQKAASYYEATVSKAKFESQSPDRPASESAFASKETAMLYVSQHLSVSILELIRFDSEEPAFSLVLKSGLCVPLGSIEYLTSQTMCRNKIAATIGILIPKLKTDHYEVCVRLLLGFVRKESAGGETTTVGQITNWLRAYITHLPTAGFAEDGISSGSPWTDGQNIFLSAPTLRQWVSVHFGDRVTARSLGLSLRAVGAEPITLPDKTNVWKLPKEFKSND
jgi:hypothetical protein